MNKSTKRWLLHSTKMLAVCGAMAYLAIGVAGIAKESQTTKEAGMTDSHIVLTTFESCEIPVAAAVPSEPEETGHQPIAISREELYFLAKIAMAEAAGEDTEGKALVIMVVLNRVLSESFPDTIEEVILEEHGGIHQFSVTQDGGRWWEVEPDEDCYKAVDIVTHGWDGSQGAMYFESVGKSTWHRDNLEFLFRHGNHFFYKDRRDQ